MRKPCCNKNDTNKGAWSKQEDQKLIDYIRKHGEGCWRTLPQAAGLLRCGKSCRLRWINYLRPDLKRGNFAEDEEDLIIKLHALLGNRWSLIAGRLPGRTDNEVKNYWNSHLRRKLINKGIDPNNHRLSRNLPRPQGRAPHTSSTATLSDDHQIKSRAHDDHDQQPVKSRGENDQVLSDAGSCFEDDDHSSGLADLNLDLSISIPFTSLSNAEEDQKRNVSKTSSDQVLDFTPSPALLLFR